MHASTSCGAMITNPITPTSLDMNGRVSCIPKDSLLPGSKSCAMTPNDARSKVHHVRSVHEKEVLPCVYKVHYSSQLDSLFTLQTSVAKDTSLPINTPDAAILSNARLDAQGSMSTAQKQNSITQDASEKFKIATGNVTTKVTDSLCVSDSERLYVSSFKSSNIQGVRKTKQFEKNLKPVPLQHQGESCFQRKERQDSDGSQRMNYVKLQTIYEQQDFNETANEPNIDKATRQEAANTLTQCKLNSSQRKIFQNKNVADDVLIQPLNHWVEKKMPVAAKKFLSGDSTSVSIKLNDKTTRKEAGFKRKYEKEALPGVYEVHYSLYHDSSFTSDLHKERLSSSYNCICPLQGEVPCYTTLESLPPKFVIADTYSGIMGKSELNPDISSSFSDFARKSKHSRIRDDKRSPNTVKGCLDETAKKTSKRSGKRSCASVKSNFENPSLSVFDKEILPGVYRSHYFADWKYLDKDFIASRNSPDMTVERVLPSKIKRKTTNQVLSGDEVLQCKRAFRRDSENTSASLSKELSVVERTNKQLTDTLFKSNDKEINQGILQKFRSDKCSQDSSNMSDEKTTGTEPERLINIQNRLQKPVLARLISQEFPRKHKLEKTKSQPDLLTKPKDSAKNLVMKKIENMTQSNKYRLDSSSMSDEETTGTEPGRLVNIQNRLQKPVLARLISQEFPRKHKLEKTKSQPDLLTKSKDSAKNLVMKKIENMTQSNKYRLDSSSMSDEETTGTEPERLINIQNRLQKPVLARLISQEFPRKHKLEKTKSQPNLLTKPKDSAKNLVMKKIENVTENSKYSLDSSSMSDEKTTGTESERLISIQNRLQKRVLARLISQEFPQKHKLEKTESLPDLLTKPKDSVKDFVMKKVEKVTENNISETSKSSEAKKLQQNGLKKSSLLKNAARILRQSYQRKAKPYNADNFLYLKTVVTCPLRTAARCPTWERRKAQECKYSDRPARKIRKFVNDASKNTAIQSRSKRRKKAMADHPISISVKNTLFISDKDKNTSTAPQIDTTGTTKHESFTASKYDIHSSGGSALSVKSEVLFKSRIALALDKKSRDSTIPDQDLQHHTNVCHESSTRSISTLSVRDKSTTNTLLKSLLLSPRENKGGPITVSKTTCAIHESNNPVLCSKSESSSNQIENQGQSQDSVDNKEFEDVASNTNCKELHNIKVTSNEELDSNSTAEIPISVKLLQQLSASLSKTIQDDCLADNSTTYENETKTRTDDSVKTTECLSTVTVSSAEGKHLPNQSLAVNSDGDVLLDQRQTGSGYGTSRIVPALSASALKVLNQLHEDGSSSNKPQEKKTSNSEIIATTPAVRNQLQTSKGSTPVEDKKVTSRDVFRLQRPRPAILRKVKKIIQRKLCTKGLKTGGISPGKGINAARLSSCTRPSKTIINGYGETSIYSRHVSLKEQEKPSQNYKTRPLFLKEGYERTTGWPTRVSAASKTDANTYCNSAADLQFPGRNSMAGSGISSELETAEAAISRIKAFLLNDTENLGIGAKANSSEKMNLEGRDALHRQELNDTQSMLRTSVINSHDASKVSNQFPLRNSSHDNLANRPTDSHQSYTGSNVRHLLQKPLPKDLLNMGIKTNTTQQLEDSPPVYAFLVQNSKHANALRSVASKSGILYQSSDHLQSYQVKNIGNVKIRRSSFQDNSIPAVSQERSANSVMGLLELQGYVPRTSQPIPLPQTKLYRRISDVCEDRNASMPSSMPASLQHCHKESVGSNQTFAKNRLYTRSLSSEQTSSLVCTNSSVSCSSRSCVATSVIEQPVSQGKKVLCRLIQSTPTIILSQKGEHSIPAQYATSQKETQPNLQSSGLRPILPKPPVQAARACNMNNLLLRGQTQVIIPRIVSSENSVNPQHHFRRQAHIGRERRRESSASGRLQNADDQPQNNWSNSQVSVSSERPGSNQKHGGFDYVQSFQRAPPSYRSSINPLQNSVSNSIARIGNTLDIPIPVQMATNENVQMGVERYVPGTQRAPKESDCVSKFAISGVKCMSTQTQAIVADKNNNCNSNDSAFTDEISNQQFMLVPYDLQNKERSRQMDNFQSTVDHSKEQSSPVAVSSTALHQPGILHEAPSSSASSLTRNGNHVVELPRDATSFQTSNQSQCLNKTLTEAEKRLEQLLQCPLQIPAIEFDDEEPENTETPTEFSKDTSHRLDSVSNDRTANSVAQHPLVVSKSSKRPIAALQERDKESLSENEVVVHRNETQAKSKQGKQSALVSSSLPRVSCNQNIAQAQGTQKDNPIEIMDDWALQTVKKESPSSCPSPSCSISNVTMNLKASETFSNLTESKTVSKDEESAVKSFESDSPDAYEHICHHCLDVEKQEQSCEERDVSPPSFLSDLNNFSFDNGHDHTMYDSIFFDNVAPEDRFTGMSTKNQTSAASNKLAPKSLEKSTARKLQGVSNSPPDDLRSTISGSLPNNKALHLAEVKVSETKQADFEYSLPFADSFGSGDSLTDDTSLSKGPFEERLSTSTVEELNCVNIGLTDDSTMDMEAEKNMSTVYQKFHYKDNTNPETAKMSLPCHSVVENNSEKTTTSCTSLGPKQTNTMSMKVTEVDSEIDPMPPYEKEGKTSSTSKENSMKGGCDDNALNLLDSSWMKKENGNAQNCLFAFTPANSIETSTVTETSLVDKSAHKDTNVSYQFESDQEITVNISQRSVKTETYRHIQCRSSLTNDEISAFDESVSKEDKMTNRTFESVNALLAPQDNTVQCTSTEQLKTEKESSKSCQFSTILNCNDDCKTSVQDETSISSGSLNGAENENCSVLVGQKPVAALKCETGRTSNCQYNSADNEKYSIAYFESSRTTSATQMDASCSLNQVVSSETVITCNALEPLKADKKDFTGCNLNQYLKDSNADENTNPGILSQHVKHGGSELLIVHLGKNSMGADLTSPNRQGEDSQSSKLDLYSVVRDIGNHTGPTAEGFSTQKLSGNIVDISVKEQIDMTTCSHSGINAIHNADQSESGEIADIQREYSTIKGSALISFGSEQDLQGDNQYFEKDKKTSVCKRRKSSSSNESSLCTADTKHVMVKQSCFKHESKSDCSQVKENSLSSENSLSRSLISERESNLFDALDTFAESLQDSQFYKTE